ncbi:MAG: hypothetical protein UY76_C0046G0010 [Candidatus Uhrbacteria bacterium GW2011_GWA2_52_8d]|uniref:Uncharacterized protein n=1 Tax=Candidatus Uhrbacteria bacterium GW2011_GWA2_52_8d TaxID=1618979 RepID=A0A0G1XLZ5_9BACT|nr:MAG: hypothetical protein UY76_C0046G0010 [Candidatus Uhrbacteria bacterium GW2011_GWA2_52_8d]
MTYSESSHKEGFKQKNIDPIDYSQSPEPKSFSEEIPLEAENVPSQKEN